MKPLFLCFLILVSFGQDPGHAFEPAFGGRYQPLRLANGELNPGFQDAYHPIKSSDRVILPGLRPQSAELLQQTLEQRYPNSFAKSPEAVYKQAIPKIFSDSPSFARARGIYAERWFVQRNPHIGLVGKRNASQMDAYSRPAGQRAPVGYQIKTLSGGPAAYARAMIEDHRARWFVIPDDHVDSVREQWRQTGEDHLRAGRKAEAAQAFRQRTRVKPLGCTLQELEDEMREGARELLKERAARYVSFGLAGALVFGPAIWNLIDEGELSEAGAFRLAHAMVLVGTSYVLANYQDGALRGTLKGNVIFGMVIVGFDTLFSIHELGGWSAFTRPGFYEHLGGSILGTSLGLTVGINVGLGATVLAVETGPFAPFIGGIAGLLSGSVASLVGQIGGRSGTRMVLKLMMPEWYLKQDLRPIQETRESIALQIQKLQTSVQ